MFVAWDGKLHRPKQDVDLLGYGNPEVGEVVQRNREICGIGGRRNRLRS